MSKANFDNDEDGGDNSNDDGSVDGNGIFEKWCVDRKGGDEADDGDQQTESVAVNLAECNGSSKMEMRVRVMQSYAKYFEGNTAINAQKSDIYSLHSNIKVNRVCNSIGYNRLPHNG